MDYKIDNFRRIWIFEKVINDQIVNTNQIIGTEHPDYMSYWKDFKYINGVGKRHEYLKHNGIQEMWKNKEKHIRTRDEIILYKTPSKTNKYFIKAGHNRTLASMQYSQQHNCDTYVIANVHIYYMITSLAFLSLFQTNQELEVKIKILRQKYIAKVTHFNYRSKFKFKVTSKFYNLDNKQKQNELQKVISCIDYNLKKSNTYSKLAIKLFLIRNSYFTNSYQKF